MKIIDNTISEISLVELVSVHGGAAHGPAVRTWGQLGPGVRANLYKDGTLRITVPKTEVHRFPNGSLGGITRRGEYVLTPKAPYGH
jgi:hypothetical protein